MPTSCSLKFFVPFSPLTLHCSRCLLAFLTHNLYLPKYLLTLDHAGISFFTAIKTTGGWALESYNSFVPPEYNLYMIMNKCMNQSHALSLQSSYSTCYRLCFRVHFWLFCRVLWKLSYLQSLVGSSCLLQNTTSDQSFTTDTTSRYCTSEAAEAGCSSWRLPLWTAQFPW